MSWSTTGSCPEKASVVAELQVEQAREKFLAAAKAELGIPQEESWGRALRIAEDALSERFHRDSGKGSE